MSGPLALLDAAGLYFRAFYALPDSLVADDGTQVNAVRGYADFVARILTERRPARLVSCLDADWRPAFRVEALPSYKAHRVADPAANIEEVPDTLTPQVPIILDLLDAVGLATAHADGYEADDVIGTLAAREATDPVVVVSGDRDLFQVVRTEPTPVSVIYVGRGWAKAEVFGPRELAQRYALPAHSGPAYADMALLRGDPSDGLPGVATVGEKTAAKLITKYGSLEGLLAAAEDPDGGVPLRVRSALSDAAAYVAAAPLVVRVATDAAVEFDRDDDRVPTEARDLDRVRELQERWNLGAPVDRLLAALAG